MKYESSAALVLTLCFATAAFAQLPGQSVTSQRNLDRVLRSGSASAPAVRTLFYQDVVEGEEQLCTLLGIRRGPNQLMPGFLSFVRQREVDGKRKDERLKFKFPKKALREEGELMLWVACLPVEDRESLSEDKMAVTIRRPRLSTEVFVTDLPPAGNTWGLDIWRQSGGELNATDNRSDGAS
jgi:hypothetical protein